MFIHFSSNLLNKISYNKQKYTVLFQYSKNNLCYVTPISLFLEINDRASKDTIAIKTEPLIIS